MNRSFQLVFAKEERFERDEFNERRTMMSKIEIEPGEITKLIEGLDKKKKLQDQMRYQDGFCRSVKNN